MKHVLTAGLVVLMLASVGAAASGSYQETAGLRPGAAPTVFGNLTVVNDTGIEDISDTLPFNMSLNETGRVNGTAEYDVLGSVSSGFPAGSNTGDLFLTYANDTEQIDVSYTVDSVSNWTVSQQSVEQDVSVGSSGVFGNFSVEQTGNVGESLTVSVSGNISSYLFTDPVAFNLPAGLPRRVQIGFEVPRDTAAGFYTGTVTLSDGSVSRQVNVSSVFSDRLPPTVSKVLVPDTMATTPSEWRVSVRDNLGVTRVSADVLKVVALEQGNTTVLENRTVGSVNFTAKQNSDDWFHTFTDTADITDYYVNVSIRDAAGNTVHRMESFTSSGLDAVQVVDSNFDMEEIRYQEKGEELIIVNDVDSPFNVTLESFSYAGNTTVKVGILPPGAESPEYFGDDRETLQYSSTGDYRLVVDSLEKEPDADIYRFDGLLSLSVPPQHVGVPDIDFSGQVNAEQYPKMRTISYGDFRGVIGYGRNALEEFEKRFGRVGEAGERQAVFIGSVPADECIGNEYWDNCAGTTFGEANETQVLNAHLVKKNQQLIWVSAGSVLVMLVFVFRVLFAGPMQVYPHTKKKNVEGLRDGS